MKSVALIACSNGLGHTRRIILLAKSLIRQEVNVTVFAPLDAVKKLNHRDSLKSINFIDFNSQTSVVNLLSGNSQKWYKSLPDLSIFDAVVSDNLIEILKIRKDAWISGSFLWHESLSKFPEKLKKESQNLLLRYKPNMISSHLFTSSHLKKYTKLYEVGLYSEFHLDRGLRQDFVKNDVLIACGKSGELINETKNFIAKLSREKSVSFNTVWVEPKLFPDNSPNWMKKATFSTEMFQSLIASVIRPGVGTITDSLLFHSKVFLYYEKENLEMKENAILLEESGLGDDSIEIDNAWNNAINYVNNIDQRNDFMARVNRINVSGAEEAADLISSSLN